MRILKWLGYLVLALAVGIAALFGAARLHDGPMSGVLGMIPGGPLEAGDAVTTPVTDWSFARDIDTIEMQLQGDATSRTTWILVDQGVAYVPCSLGFPPMKNWYKRADVDGRATLRIQGHRYAVTLKRTSDADVIGRLAAEVRRKYAAGGLPPTEAGVWFFAVASRV
jgi:hypothetical protein